MLTIRNPETFDWANMPLSDCCEGNAMDTIYTFKIYEILEEKLKNEKVWKFLENIAMPSMEKFARMEYNGIDVSRDRLASVGTFLRDRNESLEKNLKEYPFVGEGDNFNSNKQLQELFYTREGALEMYPPDRTAKGAPACNAATFKLLKTQILEELEKRKHE